MIVRVARSPVELDAADRLVAELYQEDGLPVPPVSGPRAVVLLACDDNGEALGTLRIVFHGEVAVAKRLAIKARGGTATWKGLVDAALKEMSSRGIQCMAATVKPMMQRRWEHSLGLVPVSRGLYGELGNVPAVVMVGSVDAMVKKWDRYRSEP